VGELQLMMILVQTDRQYPKLMKLLQKLGKSFVLTVREVAEEVSISKTICHEILTQTLGMSHIAAKFVPHYLTDEQKQIRTDVSQELLNRANEDENFLTNIITGVETWVYRHDFETKAQSSHWVSKRSPRPKKAIQVQSNLKVMLTVFFFDSEGVVHHEFLPQGKIVTKDYYLEMIKVVREAIRKKYPMLGGQTDGCSMLTMLPHTHRYYSVSFWRNTRQQSLHNLLTRLI
jgi:hypothetical protein